VTTVVFFNGIMASDSQYGEHFQGVDGFPNIPKVVRYKNENCELLCGSAGASNLMALVQDFFSFHFNDLSMSNIDTLLKELSSIFDSYATKKQELSNRTLLQLLLVIDGKFKVFVYNYGKNILPSPDQFPAIGTGSDYVKTVIGNNLSATELVLHAISKDPESGGTVNATKLINTDANQNIQMAINVDSFIKSNYLEQLDAMYA
jgi:hypothetical protein